MMIVHSLTVLALALAQEPSPAPGPAPAAPSTAPPQQLQLSEPRLVPQPPPARSLVPDGAPALRLDRVSRCFERTGGSVWRAQCDAATKRCVVAPDAELSSDAEPAAPLDRVPPCVAPGWREQELTAQGYAVVPGLAETPPGWRRDERQRIMQVNFDLNRRVWLGAGYGVGGLVGSDQGEASAGVRVDAPFGWGGARALARIRALETFATFDGHFADFTLFGVDASRAYPSPLLRLTTFVGKPRRFDPPLYVGGWAEAIRVESLETSAGWLDRMELGALAVTVDLWRSRDLSSFVRLRGGSGYEIADQLSGGAFTPLAAADLDVTLDGGGFHHLRATALAEWLVTTGAREYQPTDDAAPHLPLRRARYTGKAEYEVILLAVNDQPLSAVLDARAQRRNDVPGLSHGWEFQGTASLRFNLWAPPRPGAPVQDRL